MADPIDVIVRPDGDSWSAWSPQLPGFATVEPTAEDLREALPDAVRFALDDGEPPPVRTHVELEIKGVVVRIDPYRWERQHVAERLVAALGVEHQIGDLQAAPANALGEVVYVSAMPSDTVRWFADQMDPKGDWLTAVVSVAEQMVWTFSFGVGPEAADEGDDLDLDPDSPMSDLMAGAASRARLAL